LPDPQQTTFFADLGLTPTVVANNFHVHMARMPVSVGRPMADASQIIYLQVAIISQALIFVTRAHGFFVRVLPPRRQLVLSLRSSWSGLQSRSSSPSSAPKSWRPSSPAMPSVCGVVAPGQS
jgi:hypothetical protein